MIVKALEYQTAQLRDTSVELGSDNLMIQQSQPAEVADLDTEMRTEDEFGTVDE